nr:hypothetical protein [Pyrobaculum sp.]
VTLGAGVALPLQAIGIAATLLGLFVVIREEIKVSRELTTWAKALPGSSR